MVYNDCGKEGVCDCVSSVARSAPPAYNRSMRPAISGPGGLAPYEINRNELQKLCWLYGRSRFILAPSRAAVQQMLYELLDFCGGERQLSEYLGPSRMTVHSWFHPDAALPHPARRLIWVFWALTFHPERCSTALDLLTWGRVACDHHPWPVEDWSI